MLIFRRLPVFAALFLCMSCRNHYNDTIDWIDGIVPGTTIAAVKQSQPDFVVLDWEHAEQSGRWTHVMVTDIKGSYDVLNMQQVLVFDSGKFAYRLARK